MSTAAIKHDHENISTDFDLMQSVMIDIVRYALVSQRRLSANVLDGCKSTQRKAMHKTNEMKPKHRKMTNLVSMTSAPSPSRYIAHSRLSVVSLDVKQ